MSRLLINSEEFRNELKARNLYTPNNPYNIENSKVIDTINSISSLFSVHGDINIERTALGRLFAGNKSKLEKISLEILATQFQETIKSNLRIQANQLIPNVSVRNLIDNNPDTPFFSKNFDYQITRRERLTNFGRIVEEVLGRGNNVNRYPFSKDVTSLELLKNTGKGQVLAIVDLLNQNFYKPNEYEDFFRKEGIKYSNPKNLIISKNFFPDQDIIFYPFNQYRTVDKTNLELINKRYVESFSNYRNLLTSKKYQYGSTQDHIDLLGKTNNKNINQDYDDYNEPILNSIYDSSFGIEDGFNENINNKLIWGRDGVDVNYRHQNIDNPLDGTEPDENGNRIQKTSNFDFNSRFKNFKIESGLLNYTKELINKEGKYSTIDITKKKFIDKDNKEHFNGSPLRLTNQGQVDKNRQHSVADPYNRYVKAIRFNGNKIYTGNESSTIYDQVIPKFHPMLDNGEINNKNMFFSIENLAVGAYGNKNSSNIGYLDDEFGTEIPICEVGQSNGRIMWFPPYGIELSEQSIAEHESTKFIGRGEPLYTYSNTERIANLSFKLLIDYPPQSKGLNHASSSRFFAFGGQATRLENDLKKLKNSEENLVKLRKQYQELITEDIPVSDPEFEDSPRYKFYFPNDEPGSGIAPQNAIENIINLKYETTTDTVNIDGKINNLNSNFIANFQNALDTYFSQERRDYYNVVIIGSSSTLFNGTNMTEQEYNKALSQRRIDSAISYFNQLYFDKYKRQPSEDGIQFTTENLISIGGNFTDDADEISTVAAKLSRGVEIQFVRNQKVRLGNKEETLSTQEVKDKETISNQIQSLESKINELKNRTNIKDQTCLFNKHSISDSGMNGFKTASENKFIPVFHSQTPEDFHRRLTFLQQCVRQGNAVRKEINENGNVSSLSARNSVFGKQPVQILRLGDFYHTKIIISNISFDYNQSLWDLNPEGMGAQFMLANVTMQMKVLGGQSLKTPIATLQNALSFNYYANSTYYDTGVYSTATAMENMQQYINEGNVKEANKIFQELKDRNKNIIEELKDENVFN